METFLKSPEGKQITCSLRPQRRHGPRCDPGHRRSRPEARHGHQHRLALTACGPRSKPWSPASSTARSSAARCWGPSYAKRSGPSSPRSPYQKHIVTKAGVFEQATAAKISPMQVLEVTHTPPDGQNSSPELLKASAAASRPARAGRQARRRPLHLAAARARPRPLPRAARGGPHLERMRRHVPRRRDDFLRVLERRLGGRATWLARRPASTSAAAAGRVRRRRSSPAAASAASSSRPATYVPPGVRRPTSLAQLLDATPAEADRGVARLAPRCATPRRGRPRPPSEDASSRCRPVGCRRAASAVPADRRAPPRDHRRDGRGAATSTSPRAPSSGSRTPGSAAPTGRSATAVHPGVAGHAVIEYGNRSWRSA